MYQYPVQIHDDPDGLWLECPDVPRTSGEGDDMDAALESLSEGLQTVFSFHVEEGVAIPAASAPAAGQLVINLPVLVVMKVVAWNAFVASGLSKSELARRMGVARPQVDRLFDFLHHSKADQLERALAVLGFRLAVSVEQAA